MSHLSRRPRGYRAAARVAASTVLAFTLVVSPPLAGSVSASCDTSSRGHSNGIYQAGTVGSTSPYPTGVRADTSEYDPFVSSGELGIGTSMSVMLDNNGNYWMQGGWNKHRSGSSVVREVFGNFYDGAGHGYWQTWAPRNVGTYANYKVIYVPSTGHAEFYVNDSLYWSMGTAWTPVRYEIFGETQDTADQMPGGSSGHAVFRNTFYSRYGVSGWNSLSSAVHYYAPTSRALRVSSAEYDIWDIKCSS